MDDVDNELKKKQTKKKQKWKKKLEDAAYS